MVGWHHRLNGHEFEQALGDSERQGNLGYCSPRGSKELDTTEWLNNKHRTKDPIWGVEAKRWTRGPPSDLSDLPKDRCSPLKLLEPRLAWWCCWQFPFARRRLSLEDKHQEVKSEWERRMTEIPAAWISPWEYLRVRASAAAKPRGCRVNPFCLKLVGPFFIPSAGEKFAAEWAGCWLRGVEPKSSAPLAIADVGILLLYISLKRANIALCSRSQL